MDPTESGIGAQFKYMVGLVRVSFVLFDCSFSGQYVFSDHIKDIFLTKLSVMHE